MTERSISFEQTQSFLMEMEEAYWRTTTSTVLDQSGLCGIVAQQELFLINRHMAVPLGTYQTFE